MINNISIEFDRNFQITGSFDEDTQSMQGYSLTDSSLEAADGVTLNVNQERRELIVENIEAGQVTLYDRIQQLTCLDGNLKSKILSFKSQYL